MLAKPVKSHTFKYGKDKIQEVGRYDISLQLSYCVDTEISFSPASGYRSRLYGGQNSNSMRVERS